MKKTNLPKLDWLKNGAGEKDQISTAKIAYSQTWKYFAVYGRLLCTKSCFVQILASLYRLWF